MTCKEIENSLPAYLEDSISPNEKRSIKEHLDSCPRCSASLEDLKKTEELLRGLAEVEPPPWFRQKIMSRVKEEAERKEGIFKKLFYPLHIKVPIQAFATVLIAVLAFYVYQAGEPEMKPIGTFPAPVYEVGKDQGKVKSRKTPHVPPPGSFERKLPARDLLEKNIGGKENIQAEDKLVGEEGKGAMRKSPKPIMTAREKEAARVIGEVAVKKAEPSGYVEADSLLQTPPLEQKRKGGEVYAGTVTKEDREYETAPTSKRIMTAAASKTVSRDVTIYVRDANAAVGELENICSQFSAQIIERQTLEGKEFLKIEIKSSQVKDFFEKLKGVGEIKGRDLPPGTSEEYITLQIEIVRNH